MLLLFSVKRVGLPSAGNLAKALIGRLGELVPERRKEFGDVADGDTCHVQGGIGGGVSEPDVERRRFPNDAGGVPIANCTCGGDIELMSH